MIHHVSISARDPRHVADVLGELMGGRSMPFPGGIRDSFMAVNDDEHGTLIEVYPKGVVLRPGEGDGPADVERSDGPDYGPFHILLSVSSDRARVEEIGRREGWRTRYLGRGAPGQPPVFHVIEFWVENSLMIEVATPDMVAEYLALTRSNSPQRGGE